MNLNIKRKNKVYNSLLLNVIVAIAYVWFYDFIFLNFIVELFDTEYHPMIASEKCFYVISGVFPVIFFRGLKNIASIFSIFVYVFAYIPFNETLFVCGYDSEYNDYRLIFFLFMCLFFITDSFQLGTSVFRGKPKVRYVTFEKAVFALLVVVVVLNARNLHFTNFLVNRADLYDLRENLNLVGGTPVLYLIFWLKNILLPIVLISSLLNKSLAKVFFTFVGCILMFMIDQQKITFIAPFVIVLLFFYHKFHPSLLKNSFHLIIMITLIVAPFLCFLFKDVSDVALEIAVILIMRTQCIEGMELNTYFKWFGHSGINPYTYYTHIGIVNLFTNSYPYDLPVGRVVTGGGANANGVFWLMDGIAAAGTYGCVFISLIFIFVKSLFNGIQRKCKVEYFAILSLFAMSMFINVSLFTALLSCGLLLLYVLFIFVDFSFLSE